MVDVRCLNCGARVERDDAGTWAATADLTAGVDTSTCYDGPHIPVTCGYCGQPIGHIPGVRTSASAWAAPDADDPTACRTEAPGHAPVMPAPMHLWRVWPDGREMLLDTLAGFQVRTTRQYKIPEWNSAATDGSRFELRPIPPEDPTRA